MNKARLIDEAEAKAKVFGRNLMRIGRRWAYRDEAGTWWWTTANDIINSVDTEKDMYSCLRITEMSKRMAGLIELAWQGKVV